MKLFRYLAVWIVLALAGALVVQFLLARDPGYVLVRFGGYDYTSSVAMVLGGAIAAVLVIWIVWALVTLPFRTWGRHRDRKSRAQLGEGLESLHHGHYTRAEKQLQAAATDDHSGSAAWIGVARAAHARGDVAAERQALDALGEHHAASRAIAIAESALADGRPTDALVALDAPAAQPLPPRGLALRADALAVSGQSAQAYELLGALRKQHAWPDAVLAEREARWAEATLREAPDANTLAERWETLPKPLRGDAAVVAAYADRAAALRWDEAATGSIEHALDQRWDESLAARYGALPVDRVDARHARASQWLQAQPGSPALLLTLARLSLARGQRAEAEDYAHRAIAQGAGADAWEVLGDLHAGAGEDASARHAYANALAAGRGASVVPLSPARASTASPVLVAPDAPDTRDANSLPRLHD